MRAESLSAIVREIYAYGADTPEALAIVDDNGKKPYNYREFTQLIEDIAYRLKQLGVGPGTIVAIRSGRCVQHQAARIAILALGGVFLGLDMIIPDERAQLIMQQIGCKICIDDAFFPLERSPEKLEVRELPENLPAFIIFTSGSTGAPKGILHPRATITYFDDMLGTTRTEWDGCSVVSMISVSFVANLLEFVATLRRGKAIYHIDDQFRTDILAVRKFINDRNISHLICTASYLRALGLDTALKDVFVMGERAGAVETGRYNVINAYGSSEAICSFCPLQSVEDAPIGEPAFGEFTIIDDEGRVCDEGELVYRGRGTMLGYLTQLKDGIPSKPLDVYYTGDLARRDEAGLHIVGRKGDMIKINGQRVEPAEVEYILSQMEGVDSSVVRAFFDNGTYMCAYYISASGVTPEQVREYLSKKVNTYMVPKYIGKVDSFKTLANGKVDRMSLVTLRPKPGKGEAPSNETEYMLCQVFAKVLGEESVTLDDDFMKVGGDSVKAIRAQSELSDLGIIIDIDDILDNGTPRAIAKKVGSNANEVHIDGTPVTPIQGIMLSGMSRHGETVKLTLKAVAALEAVPFQKAINSVTDRHTALRSYFVKTDDGYERKVYDKGTPVAMIGVNLKATPEKPIAIYPLDAQHLVIEFHRSIIDVRSVRIVLEEIVKAYVTLKRGMDLPAVYGSDFDYWWAKAVGYRSYAQEGEGAYWDETVAKMAPCTTVGKICKFEYAFKQDVPAYNVFASDADDIALAAILRAYSRVYGKTHISTDITCTARNLAIGRSHDIVGNLDACYPAVFDVEADGSVESDVFEAMNALRGVPRAGLGFGMQAFQKGYRIFPELSLEFVNLDIPESPMFCLESLDVGTSSDKAAGISMSVLSTKAGIRLMGAYADVPELSEKFETFLGEIKNQMACIVGRAEENLAEGRIEAPLTTLQLLRKNVIVGDRKMPIDHTISICDLDIPAKDAVELLEKYIPYHPALSTRLVERRDGEFWLEYSGKPEITVLPDQPISDKLLSDFELDKALCRFAVVDKGDRSTVLADLHHQISDITTLALVAEELKAAARGRFPKKVDLGLAYAYWFEKQQKHLCSPESVREFFERDLGGLMPVSPITDAVNSDGKSGFVNTNLSVSRSQLANFATENGISVGAALTAAFGYVNALFVDRQKTSFFFLEHGRHTVESETALGMYFRVLPMSVELGDMSSVEYIRGAMKNMVKSMSIKYSSSEDYASWMHGDYVQFKYQTDMNERSGVDRILQFMPPASYMSFMVGDLGPDFEVQLKYPPTASMKRSAKLVKAYDIALGCFVRNMRLSEIADCILGEIGDYQ